MAREYRVQEQLLIYLASKGIELLAASTEENITEGMMSDPMRKAMIQMQGIFAELEKSLLVKKLKIARDRKRKQTGKCEGAKGYQELMPDVVAKIKSLRRRRKGKVMTHKTIADYRVRQLLERKTAFSKIISTHKTFIYLISIKIKQILNFINRKKIFGAIGVAKN